MSDPSIPALVAIVDEIVAILHQDSGDGPASHWARWMQKASDELKAGDFHGVERFLQAYGGMGSFNDFVPRNPSLAARLAELSTRGFEAADELRQGEIRKGS